MTIGSLVARLGLTVSCVIGLTAAVSAQPLGTFRWQLAPYCNVVSVNVTLANGVFTLDGSDDQCGAGAPRAPLVGAATVNADGTISLGLNIVTAQNGGFVHVGGTIAADTGSGTWRDSAGYRGELTFSPAAPVTGSPRPATHLNPGDGNTRLGTTALPVVFGADNTAIGAEAMNFFARFGPPVPTGSSNTAIGAGALFNINGNGNVAIGARAGCAPYDFMLADVSNNIYIGADVCEPDPAISNTIRIGKPGVQSRAFIAGVWGTTLLFPGVPVMVDGSGQLGTVSSSRRTKDNIADLGSISSAIFDLRPVRFTYKQPMADGTTPIQYGLIAEEVAEVLPELVARNRDGSAETVNYHVLPTLLLAEVQRLERERAAAQQTHAELSKQVADQAAAIAELRKALDKLPRPSPF